ncbi:MAG: hypothetical protein SFT92_05805 [Rickettsiales bacterium]|nr:hypothetical protein [Rickettsiales bacterium]
MHNEEIPSFLSDSPIHRKYVRAARNALYNMISFDEQLSDEIDSLLAVAAAGQSIDHTLYQKMSIAHEHFLKVMSGMRSLDDDSERHLLIEYGDSIHDIMLHIHDAQRRH